MLLTCDIGNTNIKTGIFKGSVLGQIKIFSSVRELFIYLRSVKITSAAISSVVPAKSEIVSRFMKKELKTVPFIISKDNLLNLKLVYDTPETLGIDRICSAEGALYIYKNRNRNNNSGKTFLLAVDFGTATTLNIVSYPDKFVGGIIMPGLQTMNLSLSKSTAQLPKVEFNSYKSLIGTSTKSSIASGILNSTLGLIEKTTGFLKSELKAKLVEIFITGGNAKVIIPYLKSNYIYEKGLVLKGIKAIYDRNEGIG